MTMRTILTHDSSHDSSHHQKAVPMRSSTSTRPSRAVRLITLVTVVASTALLAIGVVPTARADNPAVPLTTEIAVAPARYVAVYDTASNPKPAVRLDAYRNFSHRLVFRVLAEEGNRLRVQLPIKPNGVVGYVDKSAVTVGKHDYYIIVSLSAHTVNVYKSGAVILTDKVAVGTKDAPTPTGTYYLSELAKVTTKNSDYGPWAFGVSAFSTKYTHFKGGSGQIGFHGTNQPQLLGKDVSHGCIRTSNATITKLAQILPQGTPIQVNA